MSFIKNIAISQRVSCSGEEFLEQDYFNYYSKYPINLIPIANNPLNVINLLETKNLSGMILSGGNNINPQMYNQSPKDNSSYSDNRDETERLMLDFAIKNQIPVLGQCRGCQFINIYFLGTIKPVKNHVRINHNIKITDEQFKFFDNLENFLVNSFHNFGITNLELSSELNTFAVSDDGIIEGLYHPFLPIIGIMWHPERPNPSLDFNNKIIEYFLNGKPD